MLRFLTNPLARKLLALLILMLLLCIPLGQIHWLVSDRGATRAAAVAELASTYAGPQTLIGPVLVVPYVERWSEVELDDKGRVKQRHARSRQAVHLGYPQTLDLTGEVAPRERQRGIFSVLFYALKGGWRGQFAPVLAAQLPRTQADSTVEMLAPSLAFGLSDVRGVEGAPALTAAGAQLRFASGVPMPGKGSPLARGIHAPLSGAALQAFEAGRALPFELQMTVVGQERLSVAPVAEETRARLALQWPHLSFGGRFLATQRTPTSEGYQAQWAVSSLVSAAGRQLTASLAAPEGLLVDGKLDTFDVSLIQPQNPYSLADRALKYAVLFVGLTLLAAFMLEVVRRLRLHPVQYGLVGLSIALFFLLLLALSEKLPFAAAYGLAAGASVALLAVYFSAVLHGWRRGLLLAGFVALLYGALYGLLISEDNALLLGSLLVFGMLAALMVATRKVDWYALADGQTNIER